MSAFHAMRLLHPSEYADYGAHLKKLNKRDRTLRFCRPVSDEWIDGFIKTIVNDEESVVIGHYDSASGLDGALFIALVERDEGRFAELYLRETTTLGVRVTQHRRHEAPRRFETFESSLGPVRLKVATIGAEERASFEFEDLKALAAGRGMPLLKLQRQLEAELAATRNRDR